MKKVFFSEEENRMRWEYRTGTAVLDWKREGRQALLRIRLSYQGAYGMGEKYDALNQKGHAVVNQVEEKFCFQGEKTYCPAPFFWTDSGFGLYADTGETTQFCFGESEIEVRLPADCRLVLFAGTPAEILREYMGLFGETPLPPAWAFGPWISANHWDSQAKVEQAAAQAAAYGYPVSALVIEAWSDEATFYIFRGAKYRPRPDGEALGIGDFDYSESPWPDPAAMIEGLHRQGIHVLLWQIPVYKRQGEDEEPCRQNELDREDAVRRGLCVRLADGTPYTIPEGNWFAGSMIPDFTNPETEKTWFAKRAYLTELGVDGFKTDGGEFVYREDLRFCDGTDGRSGKNRYAQEYTAAYTRHLKKGQILFSRAGFSGQHTTPLHWGGDQQSQNAELKSVLTAGLSAALTGISFWGFDIAGFAGLLPTLDLYRRATQLSCFCPVMQWHSEPDGGQFKLLMPGGEGNNERSPWNLAAAWGEEGFINEMRFWHRLRRNLLPYLWNAAQLTKKSGRPLMCPLVYDWPDDREAVACEDEFLLGESLLVAPLLEENAKQRQVYLPQGRWIGLFDCRGAAGGQTVTAGGGGRLPVFLRCGYGVALHLGQTLSLGSPVEEERPSLHFILAGSRGEAVFAGMEEKTCGEGCGECAEENAAGGSGAWKVTWDGGKAQITGGDGSAVTWEIWE